jgi:hypothetical protein
MTHDDGLLIAMGETGRRERPALIASRIATR